MRKTPEKKMKSCKYKGAIGIWQLGKNGVESRAAVKQRVASNVFAATLETAEAFICDPDIFEWIDLC
jgi:hypothetical protein